MIYIIYKIISFYDCKARLKPVLTEFIASEETYLFWMLYIPLFCIQYITLLCVSMYRRIRKQREAETINDTVILIPISLLVSHCLREDLWLYLTIFQQKHGK